MDQSNMLKKVIQLFLLAESTSSPEEAQLARKTASELISKYGLKMNGEDTLLLSSGDISSQNAVVAYDPYLVVEKEFSYQNKMKFWQYKLYDILARFFVCRVLKFTSKTEKKLVLVGHSSDIQKTCYFYSKYKNLLNDLIDLGFSKYKLDGGNDHGKMFKADFSKALLQNLNSSLKIKFKEKRASDMDFDISIPRKENKIKLYLETYYPKFLNLMLKEKDVSDGYAFGTQVDVNQIISKINLDVGPEDEYC